MTEETDTTPNGETVATDHLREKSGYTTELLAQLTDAELDEQIAYFREREEWYIGHPDEKELSSHYASHAYAAFRYGNWIGMAERERASRQHG